MHNCEITILFGKWTSAPIFSNRDSILCNMVFAGGKPRITLGTLTDSDRKVFPTFHPIEANLSSKYLFFLLTF